MHLMNPRTVGTLPPVQAEQFTAQRCQFGGLVVFLLDLTRVAGKDLGSRRKAILPAVNAMLPLFLFFVACREHGDILREARSVADVMPVTVRQQSVPDNEISRL